MEIEVAGVKYKRVNDGSGSSCSMCEAIGVCSEISDSTAKGMSCLRGTSWRRVLTSQKLERKMMILGHKFTLYIPTKDKRNDDLSKGVILETLAEVTGRMGELFGGVTAHKAKGCYDGISGEVYLITSFCTDAQHELHNGTMIELAKELRDHLNQSAFALEIDSEMILL